MPTPKPVGSAPRAGARRDLPCLTVRQIREARARKLLLALLAIGKRHRVRPYAVLSHDVPVRHLALEGAETVDVVRLVLQPLDDAAKAPGAVDRVVQAGFQ